MPAVTPVPPRTRTTPRTAALRTAAPLALACAVLTALVAGGWPPLREADHAVARTMHRWALAHPGATHGNRVLTDWVWDPWTMRALAAAAALWLLARGAWRAALWLALTCGVGTAVELGVKAAVGRRRPVWRHPVDSAHYAAFPSGHAVTATVVCGALLWLLHRRRGGVLWGWAVAVSGVSVAGVAFTRVWLGVHWLSDVVAGWLFGGLVVAVAVAAWPGAAGDHGRPVAARRS